MSLNMKKKCEICAENESKYKCPQCLVFYCSLGCYKTHKEKCVKKLDDRKEEDKSMIEESGEGKVRLVDYDDEMKSTASQEIKSVESDFVSVEKLKMLKNSVELKEILANRHVRDLLVNLNKHEENIDEKVEKAMQEPLFQEFSSVCLKVVQNQIELEKI